MSTGAKIDKLYTVREKRIKMQRDFDAKISVLRAEEQLLEKEILSELQNEHEAKGLTGKRASASIQVTTVAQIEDWDSFYEFIRKRRAFDLLNKAVNNKAYRERLGENQTIPGAKPFEVIKLSVVKHNK